MPLPESHPNSVPFPPEIISIIIELLLPEDPPRCEYDGIDNESIRKIPDLSTSMQISKLWHAQALPYRFRRVMIAVGNYSDSDEPSGYLKAEERIKAFLDLVVARPQIAACVRELDIMFLGYEHIRRSYKLRFDSHQNTMAPLTAEERLIDLQHHSKYKSALDRVCELLPRLFETLPYVADFWLKPYRWMNMWRRVSPEFLQALQIYLARPALSTLRGCDGMPIHVWSYIPNLKNIYISTCAHHGAADPPIPSNATKEYAPIESLEVVESLGVEVDGKETYRWLLESIIATHPGALSNLRRIKVWSRLPGVGTRIQAFLDATAVTLREVDLNLDSFPPEFSRISKRERYQSLDFSRLTNIRNLKVSYHSHYHVDEESMTHPLKALKTLNPTNHPNLEVVTIHLKGRCRSRPDRSQHHGCLPPPLESPGSPGSFPSAQIRGDLLALEEILLPLSETSLHAIKIRIKNNCSVQGNELTDCCTLVPMAQMASESLFPRLTRPRNGFAFRISQTVELLHLGYRMPDSDPRWQWPLEVQSESVLSVEALKVSCTEDQPI